MKRARTSLWKRVSEKERKRRKLEEKLTEARK